MADQQPIGPTDIEREAGASVLTPANLLVLLFRLAHHQQENFTTESLAHLLQHLVAHEWDTAKGVLDWLSDSDFFSRRASGAGISVRTQQYAGENGIPDLRISASDVDMIVEVKLDANITLEQLSAYWKELMEGGRPHTSLVALTGGKPSIQLPPSVEGHICAGRTWADLGLRLKEETQESKSEVTRHLVQELIGLLRHLQLMPGPVRSRLSAAMQAHREWAKANPERPSITRTRLRSLDALKNMPAAEPLYDLLLQMNQVLATASGVKSHTLDSGPNMREPWIGFNLDSMAYFFYVSLYQPEHIILQRYGVGVDPKSFDRSMGVLEPSTPGGLTRWRCTLDLLEDDGRYFRISEVEQVKMIGDFFERALAFGERLPPYSQAKTSAVGQMSGVVTQSLSLDPVEMFVAEVKWRFAKTMPDWPHWYVLKDWNPGREHEFMELARRIFEEGRDEQWAAVTPYERTTRYYYAGDYKYWVMDPTIESTDLINRARVDGKGPADGFEV